MTTYESDPPAQEALIVGDIYQLFAEHHADAWTVTALKATANENIWSRYARFHLGQGLSQRDHKWIAQRARDAGACLANNPEPASERETHKHVASNIMISVPRRTASKEFVLDLLIDSKAAEISDHQTGQHLSGASLEEAARQAFLGVTERFFIPVGESNNYYFVTRGKHVEFRHFAFPLPTTLRYTVVDFEESRDRNTLSFNIRIVFEQAGLSVAEITFSFAVYRKDRLAKKEKEMATQAVATIVKPIRALPSPGPAPRVTASEAKTAELRHCGNANSTGAAR